MQGLSQSPDCRLWLAAPTNLPETMRYAADKSNLKGVTFVNPPGEQTVARIENSLLQPFGPTSVPSKAIRQVSYRLRHALDREEARFDIGQWPSRSVYHSPFAPIPAVLNKNHSVKSVQTICDIISLKHPEWFKDDDQTIKQVIAQLPADGWVVTISEATKVDFCEYTGYDPAQVVPIHLAASRTIFHPVTDPAQQQAVQQRLGIQPKPYLLSVATLEPRKNIDHLIRCFGRLVESGELPSDVQLVLVGTKGWKFDKIMEEVAHNEAVRSRLVFTGFVADEHLAALYSGALAFVYPSLYEGFGLPPLEAMQCGLPVITSNVSSLPEVVGDAAIQVPPTDADALSQAILSIARSETLRATLSAKALERASLFSWDRFVREHVELYKKIS